MTDRSAPEAGPGPSPRPRRRTFVIGIVALVVLAGAGITASVYAGGSGSTPSDALVGVTDRPAPAPAFSVANLNASSEPISLSEFRGKDLVVNFWASWCVPCRTEMPLLESTYRSVHHKVAFLGIDTNDSRPSAQQFATRTKVTYPLAFDPDEKVGASYGLYGLPVTVFISPEGKLLGQHFGQFDSATLGAAFEKAFGLTISS